jgi:hypothetical protein
VIGAWLTTLWAAGPDWTICSPPPATHLSERITLIFSRTYGAFVRNYVKWVHA